MGPLRFVPARTVHRCTLALLIKPHSVTVLPVVEPSDLTGSYVEPPTFTTPGGTVLGQVQPLSSGAAFEKYGIMLHQPSEFMCDIEDASKFITGYRVVFLGNTYFVGGEPKIRQEGNIADHASVVISKGQFT